MHSKLLIFSRLQERDILPLEQLEIETQRSYQRIAQRLRQDHEADISSQPEVWGLFFQRWSSISHAFLGLAIARPDSLRSLDAEREADPPWFHSDQIGGGVCYVDLFAGNLAGVRQIAPLY